MADLPFLAPGDPPPRSAGRFNAFIAAARKSRVIDLSNEPKSFGFSDPSIVWLRNTGHITWDRYRSVGLGQPVFAPADDLSSEHTYLHDTCFDGVWPPRVEHRGLFVVLMEPIPAEGGVGRGRLTGLVHALVRDDVATGDWVDVEDVTEFSASVSSGDDASGALVWVPHGTAQVLWVGPTHSQLPIGTRLAFVRLTNSPGPQKLQGILVEDLDAATDSIGGEARATVQLITGNPATLSHRHVEAVNRSVDASVGALTYVELGYMAHTREWSFDWIDCGPQEFSGSSESIISASGVVGIGGGGGGTIGGGAPGA